MLENKQLSKANFPHLDHKKRLFTSLFFLFQDFREFRYISIAYHIISLFIPQILNLSLTSTLYLLFYVNCAIINLAKKFKEVSILWIQKPVLLKKF